MGDGATELTVKNNIDKLEHFRSDLSERNWNGYDADPMDPTVVDRVIEMLRRLDPQPFVSPLPCGGIQIEWEPGGKYGDYLEVEIHPNEAEMKVFRAYPRSNEPGIRRENYEHATITTTGELEEILTKFLRGESVGEMGEE